MKQYLEISERNSEIVVKRIDVSSKTQRSINVIRSGINRNLNHDVYCVNQLESETELKII